MVNQIDKATDQVLQTQERVHDFVKSDAWQYVKNQLEENLKLMDSVSSIRFIGLTPEQIALEAESRANTVAMVRQWMAEVEGIASSFNRQIIQPPKDNIFINLEER